MAGNPQEELNKLNTSIKETIALLRELKGASISSKGGVVSEDILTGTEKLNNLLRERNRLLKEAKPAVSGGSPNQPGYGEPPKEPVGSNMNWRDMINAAKKSSAKSTANTAAADARAEKAAKKEAAERERLASIRNKVANDAVYREALSQARDRNLGVEDLQSIEDRGGNVQRLKFSRNVGGVNQQFNPYVNMKTGASTPGLSSQFRTFGSDIIRDIGQFTKWSIAIAAVYTPLQKLGELVALMVDNESRLADATVAANVPFEKSGEIFDVVAVSANKAGESINTTIDAYTQAIRAAGRYNDETLKQIAAVKLLNDSLILSKLSTLDQAQSIDTLSAALLQSDRSLTQGSELLNKWVRVTQIANVDLATLSTGVAVLGDSAETAGLDIDHLNGLIAVLSEQSISGAKEAANTAKALVGAYQSDKSEATLNKYGVTLRKTNGEVKTFLQIYQELAKLREQGVLSEAAVSEVALALGGGGVRRAKDASALINSVDRLNELAKESSKITGEDTLAQDALSKKLETVQTANTRLANSFQELAQTLGEKGGLLDLFKTLINSLTFATKGAEGLFAILGRSGPILTAFTAGLIALNSLSSGRRDVMLAGLMNPSQFFAGGQFIPGGGRAPAGGMTFGGGYKNLGAGILGDILKMNYRGAGIVGGLGVAAQAGSNLQAGKIQNAEANVAGGAIGAAIGAALGGPIGLAVGANIGSAIGDAFITSVYAHSEELASYFIPKEFTPQEVERKKKEETTYKEKSTSELLDLASKELGIGGNLKAFLMAGQYLNGPAAYGGMKESAGLELLKTTNPGLYSEIVNRQRQAKVAEAQQTSLNRATETPQYENQRKLLEAQAAQERQNQLKRLATGEITTAEFGRISNQLGGFPAQSIQSINAYGREFINVSKDINTTQQAYEAFLYIATNGTQDQINLLSQYSNDISVLDSYLKKLEEDPTVIGATLQLSFGDVTITSKQQLQKLMTDLQLQGGQAAAATYTQVRMQQLKVPGIVGSITEATTAPDLSLIKNQAEKLQQQFFTDMNLTTDEIENLKSKIEDFSVLVERAGEDHFETISGIDQKFWDAAQKLLVEQGKLKEQKGIGFQQFDVPMSTLQMLGQRSLNIGKSWQQKYNYDFKPEDQIAIDNQGIVQPLHADFKILALLLEKIVDQNQKQLDGQYNIPEGATFWVPLTAAYYRRGPGGEGGGLSDMLKNMDFQENTSATDRNTGALEQLTSVMSNADRLKAEYTTDMHGVNANRLKNAEYPQTKADIQALNAARLRNAEYPQQQPTGWRGDLGFGRTTAQGLTNPYQNKFPGLESSPFRGQTQVNPAPTSKLDLKFSSNINLMVDGRILANVVKTYLASELLRTEQAQGTVTKRYVI